MLVGDPVADPFRSSTVGDAVATAGVGTAASGPEWPAPPALRFLLPNLLDLARKPKAERPDPLVAAGLGCDGAAGLIIDAAFCAANGRLLAPCFAPGGLLLLLALKASISAATSDRGWDCLLYTSDAADE